MARLFVVVAQTFWLAPAPASMPQVKVPVVGLYKSLLLAEVQSLVRPFWKNAVVRSAVVEAYAKVAPPAKVLVAVVEETERRGVPRMPAT